MRDYVYCVIVCGGRDYGDADFLFRWMDGFASLYGEIMVMTGAARGADTLAEQWAKSREQLYAGFPAQWSKLGNRAGMKRNAEMAAMSQANAVVAFQGGRGTRNMLSLAYNMEPRPLVYLPCGEFWK